jgi:hypothetical protein
MHAAKMEETKMGKSHMPKKGEREIMGINFKPAKNGWTSETQHRTFRGGQGGGSSHDYGSEDMVHNTIEHAKAHLGKMMGMSGVFAEAEKKGENDPEGKPKKETPGPHVKADEPGEAAEVKKEDD